MRRVMKAIWPAALAAAVLFGLTACSGNQTQEEKVSGTYTAGTDLNRISYEFDGKEKVTLHMQTWFYEYATISGTYDINDDGTEITFTFNSEENTPLGNMSSYSGTFPYEWMEDAVLIGNVRYGKTEEISDETASTAADSSSSLEEPVKLDAISLTLPQEPFEIRYQVTEEGHGISRTYSQELIRTEQGIYLGLGDSDEKYVFERLESGKYLIYRYDPIAGQYLGINRSEAVQNQIDNGVMTEDMIAVDQNVVNGYMVRITEFFDYYEKVKSSLRYQGEETVGETVCQKYTASYVVGETEREMAFWIDPETGLCMKGIYYYEALDGSIYTKAILCDQIAAENISLPEYK